jgi:NAD-dependent dihydropyrimidine dehydrogenase PreA subunit/flavodoxin
MGDVGMMWPEKITAMYFSATGTTEKIVMEIAGAMSRELFCSGSPRVLDFTLPKVRADEVSFSDKDIVVVGIPVIAGRVPNVLLKYLRSVKGCGATAAAVVVYGNRDYDDSLVELADILAEGGFVVAAGAAFIGEHSFSNVLAKGRPDQADMETAAAFALQAAAKIRAGNGCTVLKLKGCRPYRPYYVPRDRGGVPVDIRKVVPKTKDSCISCGLCAEVCPMGSISRYDSSVLNGICIKCCACVKKCPAGAKYFDDERYIYHRLELEAGFSERKEPELFCC